MQQLSSAGEAAVNNLAQRYGVSVEAVSTLLKAAAAGGGTMAQFHHPELGGSGQWMRGGVTMVGDMFNRRLPAASSNSSPTRAADSRSPVSTVRSPSTACQ